MARSRYLLTFDTSLTAQSLSAKLIDSPSRPAPLAQKLINFMRALLNTSQRATMKFGVVTESVDAVAASMTGTATGVFTVADTITVNGVTLTAIAQAGTPTNNQFRLGTSAATVAANIAAAINASTTDALAGVVSASSNGAVLTISCLIPGVIGNNIAIAESSTAFSFAGGATVLASGSGRLPVLQTAKFSRA